MTTNSAPASDEPTTAEMEAFNTFDPVRDIPSSFEVVGDVRINTEPTLSSFSPEQQRTILDRAGNSSESAIRNAIHSFLIDQRRDFLIKAGPGSGATETQRTMLEQARRVGDLSAEMERLQAQLGDVREYRTEVDESGRPIPVPIYVVQGERRRGLEARIAELGHQMTLIAGVQGHRELTEANRADAIAARQARQQVAEFREAERRAREIVIEERIQKMAETKAKFLKDTNL